MGWDPSRPSPRISAGSPKKYTTIRSSVILSPMKFCGACGRELPEAEFGSDSTHEDGLATYCLVCMRGKRRKSRIESGRQKPDGWVRKTADRVAYRRAWRESKRNGGKPT